MWAGAREFLIYPLAQRNLTEALLRAAARLGEIHGTRRAGKLVVLVGAKGGAGVTTISTNLALALRHETAMDVVLLDLRTGRHQLLGSVADRLVREPRL